MLSAIGPAPITNDHLAGAGAVSGRITDIAPVPVNASIVHVAAAGGSIWKSTNATAAKPSWTSLTDNVTDSNGKPIPEFMGAVAETQDGSGNQIVYAGIGEANNGADSSYGVGILVSKNGGSTRTLTTTWTGRNQHPQTSPSVHLHVPKSSRKYGLKVLALGHLSTSRQQGWSGPLCQALEATFRLVRPPRLGPFAVN